MTEPQPASKVLSLIDAMPSISFVIPDGLVPCDECTIVHLGQEYTIQVPDGYFGGMELEVELEDVSTAEECALPVKVQVIVPDGCSPGDAFNVAFEGVTFEVLVPHECCAGCELTVEVPLSSTAMQSEQSEMDDVPGKGDARSSSTAACSSDISLSGDAFKFRPGQRVELLRSDGAFSPGTIVLGFEGALDVLYKVRLDNGLFKEAVPEEDLSEQTCDVGDLFDGL